MPKRPNILLITSDQQHWNTLGVLNPEIQTPALDRLAGQGVLFTRTYCANPTCTPTRASIITGLYPSQHGAYALGTKLPESAHTIGKDFQEAGYRTSLIGKAHFQPLLGTEEFPSIEGEPLLHDLDFWRGFKGPFYGFEHIELARGHTAEPWVGQHYAIWMEDNGCTNWRDYFRPPTGTNETQRRKWLIPEEFHYGTWIAERSCALLEEYAENGDPFLLWSSFLDPHPKYLVPEPWDVMYDPEKLTVPEMVKGEHDKNPPHFQMTQEEIPDFSAWRQSGFHLYGLRSHLHDGGELAKDIAIYYAMISLMDKHIGAILDKLRDLDLERDTLVVFTSDHGHFFGQHGLIAKGPFNYEDVIRVPLIARLPGKIPSGKRVDALQSLVDLAPTLLGLTGIPIPRIMTGLDQSQVWRGETQRLRDHVVVENRQDVTSVHVKTYVDERYKITVYYNQEYGDLYDMQEDPHEVRNLWSDPACADLKADLIMKLLFAEMGKEPLWMPKTFRA